MSEVENNPVLSDEITKDNVDAHLERLKNEEANYVPEASIPSRVENANESHFDKNEVSDQNSNSVSQKPSDQELANNFKSALHESRQKNKGLNGRIAQLEQETKLYQQKLAEFQQRAETTNDVDLKAEVEHLKLNQNYQRTQQEYNAQVQNFVSEYKSQAQEFQSKSPDFDKAYQFLIEGRLKEFAALGYDQRQASQLLHNEEMAMVSKAFEDGANAAERIYNLSKARGYATAKTEEKPDVDKIGMLENGLRANKSFSNSTGSEVDEDASYETLARLADSGDMAAFNQVYEKMSTKNRRPF